MRTDTAAVAGTLWNLGWADLGAWGERGGARGGRGPRDVGATSVERACQTARLPAAPPLPAAVGSQRRIKSSGHST
jgi:hypothetical protein